MSLPPVLDVEHYREDTFKRSFLLTDNAEPPVAIDITGWVFLAEVRRRPGEASATTPVATMTVTVTDAPGGAFEVSIASGVTKLIGAGDYSYDVQATEADGTVRTLVRGVITFTDDVSRSA